MYRPHGFQDQGQLLETLVRDDSMTFFPEFNLLVATCGVGLSEESASRKTSIFNVTVSEISGGEFFKGFDYVSDMVIGDGKDKAFAIIDSFERNSDGFTFHYRQMQMLSRLFSWSPTIDAASIPEMVHAVSYYQNHMMSDRESYELSHGKPLSEISNRSGSMGVQELLDKLTASETVSYFPEFNLLVTTTELVPDGCDAPQTAIFNVFPSELAYEKLFHGYENVADILYSGPVVDPIHLRRTFQNFGNASVIADGITRHLAMLLSSSDVISTQSVAELLDIMADRFGIEPEERGLNIDRLTAATEPYMDSDKADVCEQSLDSLCEEKTDEAQSMRYGMEGVGLPMLDAAEHLANY